MSLWWPVLFCLLLGAGAADWEVQMPTDPTSWSGRPVMLWGWSWTLWQQCQTGGCCRSCGWYCSMTLTVYTTLWSNRGAPSVRDWLLLNASLSTTGSDSCLWPSNFTTPPSDNWTLAIYKNKTKQTIITHSHFIYKATAISLYIVYISRLSTLLFYYLFNFIVYFNILFYCLLYYFITFYFIVYFSILVISLSLSLVFIHAVFLFLLCMEHWNKINFLPGD